MVDTSLFTGYGFYIQEIEDVDYYWDCFGDEEKEQILEDKHDFVHWLSDREMFIGWSFGRKLSKDAFIWAVNYFTENYTSFDLKLRADLIAFVNLPDGWIYKQLGGTQDNGLYVIYTFYKKA